MFLYDKKVYLNVYNKANKWCPFATSNKLLAIFHTGVQKALSADFLMNRGEKNRNKKGINQQVCPSHCCLQ